MDIRQLRHVVRAAAAITEQAVFVVIGRQAALVQFASLPEEMTRSMELDIYPKDRPDLADLIEGSIGRDSMFHERFGYHADAVGPETVRLPNDWETRAVEMSGELDGRELRVMAPEVHDLAVAKLLAGREVDFDWIAAGIRNGLVDSSVMQQRLSAARTSPDERRLAEQRIARLRSGET